MAETDDKSLIMECEDVGGKTVPYFCASVRSETCSMQESTIKQEPDSPAVKRIKVEPLDDDSNHGNQAQVSSCEVMGSNITLEIKEEPSDIAKKEIQVEPLDDDSNHGNQAQVSNCEVMGSNITMEIKEEPSDTAKKEIQGTRVRPAVARVVDSSSESELEGFAADEGPELRVIVGQEVSELSDIELSDIDSDESSSDEEGAPNQIDGPGNHFAEELENFDVPEFNRDKGPSHIPQGMDTELDYLYLLFTREMLERFVTETNRYAEQQQQGRPDRYWEPTNTMEMRAFLAIQILMGVHSLPEVDHYWSTNDLIGVPGVIKIMPKLRFKKLSQYFHTNNNETAIPKGQPGYDPLHKIAPLYNSTKLRFIHHYTPGRDLSIDEAMVTFKGRPSKWGFKVWTLAEADSGYVCNMNIYTGRRKQPSSNGLGYDVVMNLAIRFLNQNRHLYFGYFFSSIKLLQDLQQCSTYACATIRATAAGLPPDIKDPGRLRRGESIKRQCGKLVATVWHDKRDVRIISTNCNPVDFPVNRREGGKLVPVPCPLAISLYYANMGGVNLADQMRSYYGVGRECNKHWRYLVWYLLNTAISNSFIIYRKSLAPAEQSKATQLKYRLKIVTQLVGGFTGRKRAVRKSGQLVMEEGQMAGHDLVQGDGKKLVCINCSQLGRRTKKNRGIATRYKCKACDVPLCKTGCVLEYHQRHTTA